MGYPDGYPGACGRCGVRREVSGTYEAAFCAGCDEWQTPLCRPRTCPTCWGRPQCPSHASELDLAPHEVDPDYDLHTGDEAELLRRVVRPVVHGTLPPGAVLSVGISREPGHAQQHWPVDVPWPDVVFAEVVLASGETEGLYLGEVGWVDPCFLAEELADKVEDAWCESRTGWGQQVRATYEVLPRASAGEQGP